MPHAALLVVQLKTEKRLSGIQLVSMPHAALWVVQPARNRKDLLVPGRFNAARGFVGGAAQSRESSRLLSPSFNAARGFVGGAAVEKAKEIQIVNDVSMPHAALWVVQRVNGDIDVIDYVEFQCRTRLCGWCSPVLLRIAAWIFPCFNAARGFVGGAAPRERRMYAVSVSQP